MPFEISVEHILSFCILQTLLLIAILMQKRFHQIPNLFLGITFGLLTTIYVLYLLEYIQFFDSKESFKAIKRAVEQIPPPVIFIYMKLLISGENQLKGSYKKLFIVPAIAFVLLAPMLVNEFIPLWPSDQSHDFFVIYMGVFALVAGGQFFFYGYKIVLLIQQRVKSTSNLLKCLISLKEKRFRWARLMAIMYFIHGTILLTESIYLLISPSNFSTSMILSTTFYISLGYVLTINIIQNPAIIHFSSKTAGNLVLKKYEKSGLTGDEARTLSQKLNDYMEAEKPFLNSNFSINDLSDSTGIPVHSISEVTNGQMEQNFFDYTNNYRVEEFKHLAVDPNHKNVKILHLAFEAGFSSKTSFNQAFKKFTGDTPSNFIKGINS